MRVTVLSLLIINIFAASGFSHHLGINHKRTIRTMSCDLNPTVKRDTYSRKAITNELINQKNENRVIIPLSTSMDTTDHESPSIPKNLKIDKLTNSSLVLSWEASKDHKRLNKYIIEQDHVDSYETSAENLSITITGLSAETLYNFRVYAVDQDEYVSEPSDNLEVITPAQPNTIFSEDFEDCETVNFATINEVNQVNWKCKTSVGKENSQAYQINSIRNGQEISGSTWLITTHKINFDKYETERLSFWASANSGSTRLQLLYSSTYDGKGQPSDFRWKPIPNLEIPLYPSKNNSQLIFEADTVDVSEITGQVYIAFKYVSTTEDSATNWTLDQFKITGEHLLYNYSNKTL